MSAKQFHLPADAISAVAVGFGGCIATDRITVDGAKVGYMYREAPDDSLDSGWRFFAGDESEDYTNDPANFAIYDVNTIANYDAEITMHLEAEKGARFERVDSGGFRQLGSDEA